MNMLYDSESFVVVHLCADQGQGDLSQGRGSAGGEPSSADEAPPSLAREGFEIVDKRSGKEVYLDGSWAELFQQHISAWQDKTPSQDEVEETLERYAQLAHNPVVMH